MDEMNKSPPVPFTQPLMPGSLCLGRFTEDQTLCRAVVVNVLDDKCKLYYVDFGNSEVVPYSEIFELPKQFIFPEVMALHFALGGLKNLTISEDIKSYFKELVTEKVLRLRVIPPEGPPIKQYGELYLNGTNVLDLLIQKMKEKQVACNFPVMPLPQVGTRDSVKVSYVITASNFYVQLEANAEALKSVMLAVETVCTSVAPLMADQLQIGLPCCAQYSEDGKWYRAKILSVSSTLVEVLYVDYGNTDCVSLSSVKYIDPSLVKILNAQAIRCCLSGFQDNMNEYLATKFEEITLDKTLTMVVIDKLPDDVVLVELYDQSVGSHVNVGAQLMPKETAQESTRTQSQLPTFSSTAKESGECLKNNIT
jgi:tudor domain-containing protein 1/4/6/7